MRVLFVMRHPGFLRNFEAVVRELARRDHEVLIAIEDPAKQRATYQPVVDALAADGAARFIEAPPRTRDPVAIAVTQVRLALDYLRYLRPEYGDKHKLRERAARLVPQPLRWVLTGPLARRPASVAGLARGLARLEATSPI